MRLLTTASLVVLACAASACGNSNAFVSTTGPTPVSFEAAALSASPNAVFAQTMGHPSCPSVPPFFVPLNLVVRVNGGVSIVVTEVRMQFVDMSGIPMPQVTLPAPQLTTQFGTALVQARSARTFPLTLGVGCFTDRKGTVTIGVSTRDDGGHQASGQVVVTVH